MDRNFTYDPELETEEFWAALKNYFDEWQDEDIFIRRFNFMGKEYKIRLINREEIEGKNRMVFEILLRKDGNS